MDKGTEKVTPQLHKNRNNISTGVKVSAIDGGSNSRKRLKRFYNSAPSSSFNLFHCSVQNFHSAEPHQIIENGEYSMRDAIKNRKYDVVQSYLQGKPYVYDPNEEIPFLEVYMTGLEYSVYKGDWRMAILFFVNAADPSYNCFDGTIYEKSADTNGEENSDNSSEGRDVAPTVRTRSSRRQIISSRTHDAFSRSKSSELSRQGIEGSKRCNEIPGFDGLYCLVNPNKGEAGKVRSSLWLMSRCYDPDLCPSKSMTEGVKLTKKHLVSIGAMNVWNYYFEKIVFTSLLCLRCCLVQSIEAENETRGADLPNDILLRVLEYVIDDILSETIRKGFQAVANHAMSEAQDL